MAHEIAKLLLEHADSFLERSEAVRTAMSMGMPIHEIEAYLDWLDFVRSPPPRAENSADTDQATNPANHPPK
jgi:hypothetical protein